MELYINHISKQFSDKTAVSDITLKVGTGIWGLLGANGAGKTTLMRIIAGIMKPTSGRIEYDGIPIDTLKESYRDIFGYLPQEFGFYPEFTVKDYLEYMSALKGLTSHDTKTQIDDLLETLSLANVRNKKIIKLSGGMKRRVGIAQALLNDPKILILDEPTSGLDPGERIRFRNLLSEFAHNRIVLISTHIVSDIEYIANQNTLMKDGKLIASGTTDELVKMVYGKVWSAVIPIKALPEFEKKLHIVNLKNEDADNVSIRYLSEKPLVPDSALETPRLEDLYLWLFPQNPYDKEDIK